MLDSTSESTTIPRKVVEENSDTRTEEMNTADFSYSERDLLNGANKYLQLIFKNFVLFESSKEKIEITFVKAYGEVFENSKSQPQGKGGVKKSLLYNLKLEFNWYGRVFIGSSTIGSTTGLVKLMEMCNENGHNPEEWEFETKLNVESTLAGFTPPNTAGSATTTEASEIQESLKNKVIKFGIEKIRSQLKKLVTGGFQAPREPFEASESTEEKEQDIDSEASQGTIEISKDLRRQLLGKAYLRVIDGEALDENCWNLNLCTINDRDIPDLVEQLKKNTSLVTLNLSFNYFTDESAHQLCGALEGLSSLETLDLSHNQIGNPMVQSLVATLALDAAPNLKLLNLGDNKNIDDIGANIINGLKFIRKDIQVKL